MSQDYIDVLKKQSQHEDADVRLAAVQALLNGHLICGQHHEDVDWELLERWVLDPDERVRDAAILFLSLHVYDDEGVQWLVSVLSEALGRYASGLAGIEMSYLAHRDDRWFDLTWDAVSDLLDTVDNDEMVSTLTCGYVEDVLRERQLGADDPHIKNWISGNSSVKKRVLLDVAVWLGQQQDIVHALAEDTDGTISAAAKSLLHRSAEEERASGKQRRKMKSRKPGHPKKAE